MSGPEAYTVLEKVEQLSWRMEATASVSARHPLKAAGQGLGIMLSRSGCGEVLII